MFCVMVACPTGKQGRNMFDPKQKYGQEICVLELTFGTFESTKSNVTTISICCRCCCWWWGSLLFLACCLSFAVCCLLADVCWSLVVYRWPFVVCPLSFVACRLLDFLDIFPIVPDFCPDSSGHVVEYSPTNGRHVSCCSRVLPG